MNINRDNYETYFLLYLDNELSAAERKAVEEFVAQHTDLHEEMEQLRSVILSADELPVFSDKAGLLKSSASDIIEEDMLLLLDGELGADEAKVMQGMIASDARLKNDWEILQCTKSDPADTIVFADKHLLYRKEKDNVVVGRFIRWAVAAMLIGAGFFAAVTFISNKKTDNNAIADVKKSNENNSPKLAGIKENKDQKNNPQPESIKETTGPADNNDGRLVKDNDTRPSEKTHQQQLAQTQKDDSNNEVFPTAKTQPKEENLVLAANENRHIEKISPERTNDEMAITALQKKPDLRDINMLDMQKNSIAATASLTEETNDDRILYMKEEDVSHSKAAGFFRKIKRTITRKANIKPGNGNGLKIAGFEIALK